MIWAVYRGATTLAGPLIEAYLRRRERRGREDPRRRGERRGLAGVARPPGRVIWLHAASVGESLSLLPLAERILARDAACHVLVTTGTVTSARLMAERLPARALHQYVPVDRIAWVRRFLDHWRPAAAIWIESEFWPNLVLETHRRGVPMALVNARMSEASARGWARIPRSSAALLRCFETCLAQTERVRAILRALGARSVDVVGNLKLAAAPLPVDETALADLRRMAGNRPLWLAASTHPGEEEQIVRVHSTVRDRRPDLLTIVVPRHPGRGAAVADAMRNAGLTVARRSQGDEIEPGVAVYIADTIGELGVFYRVARIAFVGGSWAGRGGQNPFEPAQLGCAILLGPDMWNFPEITAALLAAGAARTVADGDVCAEALAALLADETALAAMREAGERVTAEQGGVLDRLEQALAPLLFDAGGEHGTTGDQHPAGHARA